MKCLIFLLEEITYPTELFYNHRLQIITDLIFSNKGFIFLYFEMRMKQEFWIENG